MWFTSASLSMNPLKLVMIGSANSGKTSLVRKYQTGIFEDPMYVQCSIEGTIISAPSTIARSSSRTDPKGNLQLSVWDMPGSEAYGSVRSLSYPSADVFVLCIALDHHATIDMREAGEVFNKWVEEVKLQCPDKEVPILLVGTKADLKLEPVKEQPAGAQVRVVHESVTTADVAHYIECSAKTGHSVSQVFQHAASLAAAHAEKKNRQRYGRNCIVA